MKVLHCHQLIALKHTPDVDGGHVTLHHEQLPYNFGLETHGTVGGGQAVTHFPEFHIICIGGILNVPPSSRHHHLHPATTVEHA